jgi:hypothetical protein
MKNSGTFEIYRMQPQTLDSSPTRRSSTENHYVHLHPSQEVSNVEEAARSRAQHHP